MSKIVCFSHHFSVSPSDADLHNAMMAYVSSLRQNRLRYVRGRGYVPELAKIWAVSVPDRSTVRFHINQYDAFMKHMAGFGFGESSFKIVQRKLYKPAKTKLKMNKKFTPRDDQPKFINYLTEPGKFKVLTLQTGLGKCLSMDTPVQTPEGFVPMREIKVGSTVIGRDGKPTNVSAVYPQYAEDMYRITFADGRGVDACKDHLWEVHKTQWPEGSRVITTEEMIRYHEANKQNRLSVPLIVPYGGEDKELPLHPWVVGALLGGGGSTGTNVTFTNSDVYMQERMASLVPEGCNLVIGKDGKDHRFVGSVDGKSIIRTLIKEIDLNGKRAWDKHIPEEYFHGSVEQRKELLRGLMDTDGEATKGGSAVFSTTSPKLASGIVRLARSLGHMAKPALRQTYYTYKGEKKPGRPSFRVTFRAKRTRDLFTMPSKLANIPESNQYSETLKLGIKSIERIEGCEAQCITVDNEDKLFVCGSYVVTHNTYCALEAIYRIQERTVLIVPAKYVDKWIGDVKEAYGSSVNLMVCQGGKHLRTLLAQADEGVVDADFIIISATTMYNYYKEFSKGPVFTYDVIPEDFYEKIGAGIRLIDEVHENLHLNYCTDLYSNVPKGISLSATTESDQPIINRVFETMFPLSIRPPELAYNKYVNVHAIFYRSWNPEKIRCQRQKMYSHTAYEEYLMKKGNQKMLEAYIAMILDITKSTFVDIHEPGLKTIIYAATVDMCKLIATRCKLKWPRLKVSTKVSGDSFDVLDESDIISSTLISTGTAVDIPNLRTVLMTTALSARQANLQCIGRLRVMKGKWKGTNPDFYYLVNKGIQKHLDYHTRKRDDIFAGRALSQREMHTRFTI